MIQTLEASPRLTSLRGALSWLAFPAMLAGVVLGTNAALRSDLPRPLASGAVLLAIVLTTLALERLAPLHRAWNALPERTDLALLVFNRLIDLALLVSTLAAVEALGERASLIRIWPTDVPWLVQLLLGMCIGEAIRYGFHRLSHLPGLLMKVHFTHHAPARMYSLNGPRLHPANYLWISVSNIAPLVVTGAELSTVILVVSTTAFFVVFQHANVQLRFDGWNLIFATPDVHRLHHAKEAMGEGVNYGIVLSVLDRLFGTYRAPAIDPDADAIGWTPEPIRASTR